MARILWHEKTIDVFTTHMVSYFTKVILVWLTLRDQQNAFSGKRKQNHSVSSSNGDSELFSRTLSAFNRKEIIPFANLCHFLQMQMHCYFFAPLVHKQKLAGTCYNVNSKFLVSR